jgi:hypothetical protein
MVLHELTWIMRREKKVDDPFPVVNFNSIAYGIEGVHGSRATRHEALEQVEKPIPPNGKA